MPKHAAAVRKDPEEWNESPSPEEIERRRKLLAEIRVLRSHPRTEEERDFWREFDEEVARGPWPPVDAPVTEEEMEHRKRIAESIREQMEKPATEEDEKLWQEFLELGKERLTFR